MPESDFLLTMAEIAIAFVAFATIVIVFRQSVGHDLTALQILVGRSLIELALGVTLLSLLPIVLSHFDVAGPDLWRTCSAFLAVFFGWFACWYPVRRRKASGANAPARRFTYYFVMTGSAIATLGMLANTLVWAEFAIFALGLFWGLLAPSTVFLWSLTVFLHPTDADRPDGE
jgi:hypothetical protein